MKKILLFILILSGLLLISPVYAVEERIHSFKVDIQINSDSSLDITETIHYDFETLERHGIYRDIPYKYNVRGGNFNLRLSNFLVEDENGKPYKLEVSNNGDYKRLKIGDADITVTGWKNYIIKYKVKRAINFFNDYDELYWNATGDEWTPSIVTASAVVHLPQELSENDLQMKCLHGAQGSTEECITGILGGEEKGVAFLTDNIMSGQGMTIVLGWPKGIVNPPTVWQNILDIIKDNGILLLPIIVFFILLYLWRTKGKDPQGRGTIVPEYNPPDNLSPAECGTIIDEQVDKHDISAEIIHLAIKGYLKITRIPKKGAFGKDDYQLEKLKSSTDLKNNFQQHLMNSLFSANGLIRIATDKTEGDNYNNTIKISSLKNKFYKDLEIIKNKIYTTVVTKGYFPKNPNTVKATYGIIGAGLVFITFIFLSGLVGGLATGSLVASGILIIIFGWFMPVKTQKGVLIKEHILGLKMYLAAAEKDRLEFHNAPTKDPKTFEKLLPYAMVLKVEKVWAKQFENIYTGQPGWYSDPANAHFNAFYLANALSGFQANASSTLTSRPSSAARGGSGFSGGFSGGGFGGGGGGSW